MTDYVYELRYFARKWNLSLVRAVAILRMAKSRAEANAMANKRGAGL